MREFKAEGGAGKKQRSTYFLTHLKLVKGAASGRVEERGRALHKLGTPCKSGSSEQVAGLSGTRQGERSGKWRVRMRSWRECKRLRHSTPACVQRGGSRSEQCKLPLLCGCQVAGFAPLFLVFFQPFFGGHLPQAAMNLCS